MVLYYIWEVPKLRKKGSRNEEQFQKSGKKENQIVK